MEKKCEQKLRNRIRRRIIVFIICLCISGITAFPLQIEISILHDFFVAHHFKIVSDWIEIVYGGIKSTEDAYPFMAYGTDWLAFSHLVIAVAFLGPIKDPVKNVWVIQFGRIACVMIFPLAFICGNIRGIPFWWQLIDCSFGVIGFALLSIIYRDIYHLEISAIKTNN